MAGAPPVRVGTGVSALCRSAGSADKCLARRAWVLGVPAAARESRGQWSHGHECGEEDVEVDLHGCWLVVEDLDECRWKISSRVDRVFDEG